MAESARMPLALGTRLGPYEITSVIGAVKGSAPIVYRSKPIQASVELPAKTGHTLVAEVISVSDPAGQVDLPSVHNTVDCRGLTAQTSA